MALCISVGPGPPVVNVQSVPATVAPHSPHITTASQTASIPIATIAHATTRTTRHPIAVQPIKAITHKKPPGQPSVTEAKAAAVTSLRLTTSSAETTAPPRPGISAGFWFIRYYFIIYSDLYDHAELCLIMPIKWWICVFKVCIKSFMCFCVLTVCGKTKADIVFLVDESSSIGANNFIKMKDFMFRVATYFPVIGPQGTQVSLLVKTLFVFPHTSLILWWRYCLRYILRFL